MTDRPKSQLLSTLQSAAPSLVPPGLVSLFDTFMLMGKAKYKNQWTSGQIVLDDHEKKTSDELLGLLTHVPEPTQAPPPPTPVSQFVGERKGGEPSTIDGPRAIEERVHEAIWTDRIHGLWDELRTWLYSGKVSAQGLIFDGQSVDFPKQTWLGEGAQSVPEDGKLSVWVQRNRSYKMQALLLIEEKSLTVMIEGNDSAQHHIGTEMYTTPYLDVMNRTIEHFLPSGPGKEKKDVILHYLQQQTVAGKPISKNLMKAMATLLRDPEKQKGRGANKG